MRVGGAEQQKMQATFQAKKNLGLPAAIHFPIHSILQKVFKIALQ
jgi:hypothetical protein